MCTASMVPMSRKLPRSAYRSLIGRRRLMPTLRPPDVRRTMGGDRSTASRTTVPLTEKLPHPLRSPRAPSNTPRRCTTSTMAA